MKGNEFIEKIEMELTGAKILDAFYDGNSSSWILKFTDNSQISFYGVWRLFEDGKLCSTSNDHNCTFGSNIPFDGVRALREMSEFTISSCKVDSAANDIYFTFVGSFSLQLLASSAGYENWSLLLASKKTYIAQAYEISEY